MPLRVYIEDTDAGGIVYYVNYLKFMERARTEFMRALGFDKNFIFTHELMFVVKDVQVDYRAPARLDDELRVTAALDQLGGASMVLRQTVQLGEQVLVSALIKIASVERRSLRPVRLPPQMVATLKQAHQHNSERENTA